MALQFDKINACEDQIIRVKRLWEDNQITFVELQAALASLKTELRELYGWPPVEP